MCASPTSTAAPAGSSKATAGVLNWLTETWSHRDEQGPCCADPMHHLDRDLSEVCRPWSCSRPWRKLYPLRFIVEQPKNGVSELQFEKFSMPTFIHSFIGRGTSKLKVCSGSGHPAQAVPGITEVEMANSVDDHKTSRSLYGRIYPNFQTLDASMAATLEKNIQNWNFTKKIHLEEQQAQKEDRFLRDRQIAYMIYAYFPGDGHSRVHSRFLRSDGV